MISLVMIALQVCLSFAFIFALEEVRPFTVYAADVAGRAIPMRDSTFSAAGVAVALVLALGLSSILKSRLLSRILDAPVQGWRWPLIWAAAAGIVVGTAFTFLPPWLEWFELLAGIPAILGAFGLVLWLKGFTHEDRVLFRSRSGDAPTLPTPKLAPREP